MGIKEDFDIVHYKFPLQVYFEYDGTEILDARVRIDLRNAAGDRIRGFTQELTLTAGQKSALANVLNTKLAAFESATGWTDIDA